MPVLLYCLRFRKKVRKIGKSILRALIDCVLENVLEWLALTVDVATVLKGLLFIAIIRWCYPILGCLSVAILILLLLLS